MFRLLVFFRFPFNQPLLRAITNYDLCKQNDWCLWIYTVISNLVLNDEFVSEGGFILDTRRSYLLASDWSMNSGIK